MRIGNNAAGYNSNIAHCISHTTYESHPRVPAVQSWLGRQSVQNCELTPGDLATCVTPVNTSYNTDNIHDTVKCPGQQKLT